MEPGQITTVAKGISDFGLLAIAAGTFILLSAMLWIFIFSWFKNIINNIIENQNSTTQNLLDATKEQSAKLDDISEGLRNETLLRIRNIANVYFDYSKELVSRIVKRVREENHIANKEATHDKIHALIKNIHDERNSSFDCFTYRGHKLSSFTDPEWINTVSRVVENEIYHPDGPDNRRSFSNIAVAYDNIKLSFYSKVTSV